MLINRKDVEAPLVHGWQPEADDYGIALRPFDAWVRMRRDVELRGAVKDQRGTA